MPHKRTTATILHDLVKAGFERKTVQGKGNKIIDAFFEGNFAQDEALHFINEVVIHRHPRQHVRNTWKYGVKPRMNRKMKELAKKVFLP